MQKPKFSRYNNNNIGITYIDYIDGFYAMETESWAVDIF